MNIKKLIQPLMQKKVAKAKTDLIQVNKEVEACMEDFYFPVEALPEDVDRIEDYCYTYLEKLRKREQKLIKFIDRWEVK